MNALALAFGLLTAVPVRRLPRVDRPSAGAAMLLAPLTTVPLLLVVLGAHHLTAPPLLVAALVLLTEALVTRGLHLDGLADTADGLSAGPPRERRRAAMKASDTGPSGVVALVLGLLLQATALAALLPTWSGTLLAMLAWVVSRHVLAWACHRRVPAAGPDGLGASVAGSVDTLLLGVAVVWVVLAAVAVGLAGSWWAGLVVVAAGVVAGLAVAGVCVRAIGGVTGDVLGACVEVALTAGLVAAALVVG